MTRFGLRGLSHSTLGVTALLLLAGCGGGEVEVVPTFDYERDVGLALTDPDVGLCLSIANDSLALGSPIAVVDSSPGGRVAAAVVEARLPSGCTADPLATDQPAYRIRVTSGTVNSPGVYFGLVYTPADIDTTGGVSADLDGDGTPERFRVCLSREGVHFAIWTFQPFDGQRRWHRYLALGFDTEPSCEDRDFPV